MKSDYIKILYEVAPLSRVLREKHGESNTSHRSELLLRFGRDDAQSCAAGKAVVVCGSTQSRHGIVLAKSGLAKKRGVKTGMVNWEASQCCPDIIMVPPQYDEYLKYSKLTRTIYERHTDQVEGYGMDEGWCDVSGRSPEKQYSSLRQTTAGQAKSMP